MQKPQYKDLKFNSKEEFNEWLKEKTRYIIFFDNHNFDPTEWYLDKHGEVLHSDFQARVWNGKLVVIEDLLRRDKVNFQDGTSLKYTPAGINVIHDGNRHKFRITD